MGVLRQCVGAGQHEQRAVKHIIEVEYPCRGRIQDIALEDLPADDGHQRDDQPGRGLSDPGADAINCVEETLDVHPYPPLSARRSHDKAPSGRLTEWCSARSSAPLD